MSLRTPPVGRKNGSERAIQIREMYWADGMEYGEIAKALQIHLQTVKMIVRRESYAAVPPTVEETKTLQYGPNQTVPTPEGIQLILTNSRGVETARTLIDEDKLPLVITHRWSLMDVRGLRYAYRRSPRVGSQTLHQFLIEDAGTKIPPNHVIAHVNHDTLDNRLDNLTVVAGGMSRSRALTRGPNGDPSIPRGVTFEKGAGRYRSQIGWQKRIIHLMGSADPYEAHYAYLLARSILHWDARNLLEMPDEMRVSRRVYEVVEDRLLERVGDVIPRKTIIHRIRVLREEWGTI